MLTTFQVINCTSVDDDAVGKSDSGQTVITSYKNKNNIHVGQQLQDVGQPLSGLEHISIPEDHNDHISTGSVVDNTESSEVSTRIEKDAGETSNTETNTVGASEEHTAKATGANKTLKNSDINKKSENHSRQVSCKTGYTESFNLTFDIGKTQSSEINKLVKQTEREISDIETSESCDDRLLKAHSNIGSVELPNAETCELSKIEIHSETKFSNVIEAGTETEIRVNIDKAKSEPSYLSKLDTSNAKQLCEGTGLKTHTEIKVTFDKANKETIEIFESENMGNSQSKESDDSFDFEKDKFGLDLDGVHNSLSCRNQNRTEADVSDNATASSRPVLSVDANEIKTEELSDNSRLEREMLARFQNRQRLGSAERNVFSDFPVGIQTTDSETSTTTTETETESETDSSDSIIERTTYLEEYNQMNVLQSNAPETSAKAASDFLSSFEKFLQNQSPDEKSDSSSVKNVESIKSIATKKDICKANRRPIFKSYARSQKLKRANGCKETISNDSTTENVESEYMKKAKEKYQCLKELRVTLNATEVEHSESHLTGKPSRTLQKHFIAKSKCAKASFIHSSKKSELSSSFEQPKKESFLTVLDNLTSSLTRTVEECTKPLKKRGRRGGDENIQHGEVSQPDLVQYDDTEKGNLENVPSVSNTEDKSEILDLPDNVSFPYSQNSAEKLSDDDLGLKSSLEKAVGTDIMAVEQLPTVPIVNKSKKSKSTRKKGKGKTRRKKPISKEPPSECLQITNPEPDKPVTKMHHPEPDKPGSFEMPKTETDDCYSSEMEVINTRSDKHKVNKMSAVTKKYPERSCKLRQSSPEKTVSKKDPLKSRVPVLPQKVVRNCVSSSETGQSDKESIHKAKKKRRRKVKPWSWGNEKRRYKPKPKIESEVSDINESDWSSKDNKQFKEPFCIISHVKISESEHPETEQTDSSQVFSEPQLTSSDESEHVTRSAKYIASPVCNIKSKIENVSVLPSSIEDEIDKTMDKDPVKNNGDTLLVSRTVKGPIKRPRKRGKSRKGNRNKKGKQRSNSSTNAENDLVNLENPDEIRLELDHFNVNQLEANNSELHENFPQNVSPDSGIQSLTGSPAGNESPNPAFSPHHYPLNSAVPHSSSLRVTAIHKPVTKSSSNHIIASKNGIVSSVLCAAASASLSSTSVTTSVRSSTETVSVFSKSVPISSATATVAVNPLPLCDMLTSNVNLIAFPILDSQLVGATLANLELTKDACSKKKNRAKFLQLHKASTLLQKGRLPTEEEKEQRLEDKFDYLSKTGAKSVCDVTDIQIDNLVNMKESENENNVDNVTEVKDKSSGNFGVISGETEDLEMENTTDRKEKSQKRKMKRCKNSKKGQIRVRNETIGAVTESNHTKETNVHDLETSMVDENAEALEHTMEIEEPGIGNIKNKSKKRKQSKHIRRCKKHKSVKNNDIIVNSDHLEHYNPINHVDIEHVEKTEQMKNDTEENEFIEAKKEEMCEDNCYENIVKEKTLENIVIEQHTEMVEADVNEQTLGHDQTVIDSPTIADVTVATIKRKPKAKRKKGRRRHTKLEKKGTIPHELVMIANIHVDDNDIVPDVSNSRTGISKYSPLHTDTDPNARAVGNVSDNSFPSKAAVSLSDSALSDDSLTASIQLQTTPNETNSNQVNNINENNKNVATDIISERNDKETAVSVSVESLKADSLSLNTETAADTVIITELPDIPIKRKPGRPPKGSKIEHGQNGSALQNYRTKIISKLNSPPYRPPSYVSPSCRPSPVKYHPGRPASLKYLPGRSPPFKAFPGRSPPYKSFPGRTLPFKQKYQELITKKKRGRPKGSKNKVKTNIDLVSENVLDHNVEQLKPKPRGRPPGSGRSPVRILPPNSSTKRGRGRPKGAGNKLKKSITEENSQELTKNQNDTNPPFVEFSQPMMQWRESSIIPRIEEEKKKRGRGRPPKNAATIENIAKKNSPKGNDIQRRSGPELFDQATWLNESFERSVQSMPVLIPDGKDFPHGLPDEWRSKHGTAFKNDIKPKKRNHSDQMPRSFLEHCDSILSPPRMCQEQEVDVANDFGSREPAQSVSSLDSDTSGGGSSLGTKTSAIQMWMEISKHRRKKSKKKLFHFRSKHKNIIDPVFNAEVDYLTNMIPRLSISPRGETYLKVRPGEMPLPSIFKIARIDVKKKKKDKLFVFEKAKPLKPKNDSELSTKDKIRLGRKISLLGENFLDLDDLNNLEQCNLPPKKRLKLFSTMGVDGVVAEGHQKLEKRKGRPRKTRSTSPQARLAFGKYM